MGTLLAINPKTGRLVWYYQETPGDQWDIGANAPMILVDREVDGHMRKLLLHAPKNGLFYVLDRTNGKLISAKPFAQVNWLKSLDPATGRPTVDLATVDYRDGPKLVFPSIIGAHSWQPMAYSPKTGLVYLPTLEAGNIIYDITPERGYRPSLFNANVGFAFMPGIEANKASLPKLSLSQAENALQRTAMRLALECGPSQKEDGEMRTMIGSLAAFALVFGVATASRKDSGPVFRSAIGSRTISGAIFGLEAAAEIFRGAFRAPRPVLARRNIIPQR